MQTKLLNTAAASLCYLTLVAVRSLSLFFVWLIPSLLLEAPERYSQHMQYSSSFLQKCQSLVVLNPRNILIQDKYFQSQVTVTYRNWAGVLQLLLTQYIISCIKFYQILHCRLLLLFRNHPVISATLSSENSMSHLPRKRYLTIWQNIKVLS